MRSAVDDRATASLARRRRQVRGRHVQGQARHRRESHAAQGVRQLSGHRHVAGCADTARTSRGLRAARVYVPASCVLYVPEAQGRLPRGATHRTRTSLGRAVRTAYCVVHPRSPVLVNQTSVEALAEEVAGMKLEERGQESGAGCAGDAADGPAPQTPQERKGGPDSKGGSADSRRNPRRAVRQSPLSPAGAACAGAASGAAPGSGAGSGAGSLERPSPMQLPSTSEAARLQLGGLPVTKV